MRIQSIADLGAAVRDARRRLGLTQGELADRAGVSVRWLRSLETGKAASDIGLVLRTLAALGLAISVSPAHDVESDIDLDDVLSSFDRPR